MNDTSTAFINLS